MDLLVLGGTAFLGFETATQAVARGWRVTCAARGLSGPVPEGAELVRVDRDAQDGLAPLRDRRFDAVIDVGRQPGQVRRAVRDVDAAHRVLVSTINVYADVSTRRQDESAPLLAPLEAEAMSGPEDYGAAKVACERIVAEAGSHTLARAGLIGGPGDATGRSGWWPLRFAADPAGPVVVPEATDQPVQLIDVRDLGAWLLDAAEQRLPGASTLAGETTTLATMLATARDVAGHHGPLLEATTARLEELGVAPWMGPRSLPMWLPMPDSVGFLDHDTTAAERTGLRRRPLAETLRDALAWERTQPDQPHGAGLTEAEHAEIVAALSA